MVQEAYPKEMAGTGIKTSKLTRRGSLFLKVDLPHSWTGTVNFVKHWNAL